MISYNLISYMMSELRYHVMISNTYYILYDIICWDIIYCYPNMRSYNDFIA